MIYKITRTSNFVDDKKPYEKAILGGIDEYDRIIWHVEINTLEELQALQKEVKCSIIVSSNTIEIYDDYRE